MHKKNKYRNIQCSNRRQFTYMYSFQFDGKKIRVCKTFFLHTLDISAQMVETAFDKQRPTGLSTSDTRGKQPSANHMFEERNKIIEHIQSFPRVQSHYCRKETGKEYLESNINKEMMYRLFKESRENIGKKPASKWLYMDVMKNFNIAFHQRSKDQCAMCTSYNNANETDKAVLEQEYQQHQTKKENVHKLKEEAKKVALNNVTHASCVFDLEEVLSTPKISVGDADYMRKLSTYNFTVYNYGSKDVFCYLWSEHVASRGSNEISSCVHDYIIQWQKEM